MKKTKRFLLLLLALLLFLPFASGRAETKSGVVRVLLTKLNLTDRAEIALDGSYTLNGISFQRGSHLTVSCQTGTLMVYYEGMALDTGKSLTFVRHALRDSQENGVRINGQYELHPGDLEITIQAGRLQAILHAPIEEYLLGVVPYEMSDSFPLEALKAQAIAARTYALRKAGNPKQAWDVVDNTNDQAYYGVKDEQKNAAMAVRETAGICGVYNGQLAECFYSASNGGQTELASHVWGGGDLGYLVMTDDPYDLENPESTVRTFTLKKRLDSNDGLGAIRDLVLGALSETLESMGYDGDTAHIQVTDIVKAETALPMYHDSPSRIMTKLVLTLSVQGRKLIQEEEEEEISIFAMATNTPAPAGNGETWSGMQRVPQDLSVTLDLFPAVRNLLNLTINGGTQNELISVRETDTAFVLESRRYGHGVGMSQRGAQCMAGNYGWTYEQILRFYYPGMALKKMTYDFALPSPVNDTFLATPGPAATPTPRPTLMPLSVTPGPNQRTVRVTNIGVNSYLNLRAEPTTQASVLCQLYYGQPLLVLEDLGDWVKVRTDQLTGYVMIQYVSDAKE